MTKSFFAFVEKYIETSDIIEIDGDKKGERCLVIVNADVKNE